MLVEGRISWFRPEEWVKDKEGKQIYNQYGEPIKKRRVGINADYEMEDGTIIKERFVAETSRDFSDEELQTLQDEQVTKSIALWFDDKEATNGHHYMVCVLTAINNLAL